MNSVELTKEFNQWYGTLRGSRAQKVIKKWIRRYLERGALGDVKPVGDVVSEFRIDSGPGYRVYYTLRDQTLILLWGGKKDTQGRDIDKAKNLASNL